MWLRQLSCAIKTQLKAPKAPTRGISCLSLVLYGIRIGSEGLWCRVREVHSSSEIGRMFLTPTLSGQEDIGRPYNRIFLWCIEATLMPERQREGQEMPWTVSLWQKRAGVATSWSQPIRAQYQDGFGPTTWPDYDCSRDKQIFST